METKKILFFPGQNAPIKRYKPYFHQLSLVEDSQEIVLCHSKGIEKAMEQKEAKLIIAIDPSEIFPIIEHLNIIIFIQKWRMEQNSPDPDDYIKVTKYIDEYKIIDHKKKLIGQKHVIFPYEDDPVKPFRDPHWPFENKRFRDMIMYVINAPSKV